MRKTSQDGGDSTSITSGIENEMKKSGAIIKTKRNSIKRKVQNFSLESDDAVIEPLLQKDKEKTDTTKQSAKFNLLSKPKTEANSEKGTDKDKLISDDKLQKAALANASDVTDIILPVSSVKENSMSKLTSANAPLHNHMNTNVFSNHDGLKTYVAPKSQILVEIDGSKHVGYNPSPLIFTTAKIHTDGKTKHMEPVQITPVPILSTIEVSMKSGINSGETSGQVTSNISAVYIPQSNKNVREPDPKPAITTVSNTTTPQNKVADTKILIVTDKIDAKSNTTDKSSLTSSSHKEIKLTQPIAPTCVKDNFTGNKNLPCKTESQSISSTSEKDKTIVPHEAKSGSVFTKMANSSIKGAKKDTDSWHSENKMNLNETSKPESLVLQSAKPSDHDNSLDKTRKDKPKNSTSTSLSSSQLQRQNIVVDKDDPISKLKLNIASPPVTNDPREIHKSAESQNPSRIEINNLSDQSKLPKSSANSIPSTSVTSVSTNNSAADNKNYASATTAATLNKNPSPITSNVNSADTNNPTTTTSNVKNISAATNKVAVSKTTPAPITTAVTDHKSSVSINKPVNANKASPTNMVNLAQSTTTSSNKISSPATSIATGNKLTSTLNTADKISSPMMKNAATNNISSPSTTASTKTPPSPATTGNNKVSSPSSTKTAGSKFSKPITTNSATNKAPVVTSTINAVSNKTSSSLPTIMTGNKISTASSTTTAVDKVPKQVTSTATAAINKMSDTSTTSVTGSKTSTTLTTPVGGKVSTPSIPCTGGNKIPSPSTATTAATKTISSPVITTTATKMTSGSTTITTGVGKTISSNSNSSVQPTISSSNTLSQSANIPITKSAIANTPSDSKPIKTEKYSNNNSSTFTNIKSEKPIETSTTTASTVNTKLTNITTTTKSAIAATPTTTSQRTTAVNSPTVTTAKSVPTKTTPQPALGKSTEITPKSSITTSNEKPITAKTNATSISLTTTSGMSSVTSSTTSAVSSGSSPASVEAKKQSDSKSKVIGNGSKSFKA